MLISAGISNTWECAILFRLLQYSSDSLPIVLSLSGRNRPVTPFNALRHGGRRTGSKATHYKECRSSSRPLCQLGHIYCCSPSPGHRASRVTTQWARNITWPTVLFRLPETGLRSRSSQRRCANYHADILTNLWVADYLPLR